MQCLYVDDWPGHLAAAIGLGHDGCVLRREVRRKPPRPAGIPSITTLTEVLDLLSI